MTRPSVIFFGKDGDSSKAAKIFLRTLLYSTADKGQYIESVYVKLTRGDTVTTFNIWTYGEMKNIKRGSGLFVGKKPKQIWRQRLTVSKKEAKALKPTHAGLYFDWQPKAQEYETYLEDKTEEIYTKQMIESLSQRNLRGR